MSIIKRGRNTWMMSTAQAATDELKQDVEILKSTVANKKIIEKQVRGEVLDEIDQNILIGKQTAPVTSKLAELTGRVDETNKKLGEPLPADIDPAGNDMKRGVIGRLDDAKADPNLLPALKEAAAQLEEGIVASLDEVKKQIEIIANKPEPDAIPKMMASIVNLNVAIDNAVAIADQPGSTLSKSAIYQRYEPIIRSYTQTIWNILESDKIVESEGASKDDLERELMSVLQKIEGIKITAKAVKTRKLSQEEQQQDIQSYIEQGEQVLIQFSDKVGVTPDKLKERMKEFGVKAREYKDIKRGVTLYENIEKLKEMLSKESIDSARAATLKTIVSKAMDKLKQILAATPMSSPSTSDDELGDDDEPPVKPNPRGGPSTSASSSESLSTPQASASSTPKRGTQTRKQKARDDAIAKALATPKGKDGKGVKKMSLEDILAKCMAK